jgi:hydroxypyruvate reductase/glycerate 2-kinase
MQTEPTKLVKDIFQAALTEADPYAAVLNRSALVRGIFTSGKYESISYLAFGKAAPRMAQAFEAAAGNLIKQGIVITTRENLEGFKSRLQTPAMAFEAAHPVPDEAGFEATQIAMDMARQLKDKDLLVCLISGGGSALLCSPASPLTLADIQKANTALIRSGTVITETNTVRRHISSVKGGHLAKLANPAGVVSLIVSDVVGDQIEAIASGPTAPDPTTFNDALDVINRHGINMPDQVMDYLRAGANGDKAETLKPDKFETLRVTNILAASNGEALKAAFNSALNLRLHPATITDSLTGDVQDAARWLFDEAQKERALPACLISGGETTVKVTGTGRGGRNMELALRFALLIDGKHGITLLSAGTDGVDGGTNAAGAIVDGKTIKRARKKGLDPDAYLKNNDSYNFFNKLNALYVTGPTGTNVMDIQVMVLT